MPMAKLNGLSMHYQQVGQGQDVVMVHGLFSSLAFWYLSVAPALTRDVRLTMYDLRGHGYSEMAPFGYTSFDLAGDLHALLDHLGIGRAHLVGHSYGGAVILHYALLHPDRVASLTAADAYLPCFQPPLAPPGARRWTAAADALRRTGLEVPNDLPRVAYEFLEEQLWQRREDGGQTPSPPAQVHFPSGPRAKRQWLRLMTRTSAARDTRRPAGLTAGQIRRIEPPTLAIFGEHSSCMATLRGLRAGLERCRTVIVPEAGHLHPMFRPESFARALIGFIASEPATNRARHRP